MSVKKEGMTIIMPHVRLLCAIVLLSLGLFACSSTDPAPQQPDRDELAVEKESGVLYVTPVDLFTGEAARLKPFLGEAGAVKLAYTGNKRMIKCSLEVWENGQMVQTISSMSSAMNQKEDSDVYSFDGELIITIDEVKTDEKPAPYAVKYAFVDEQGYSMGEGEIPFEKEFSSRGGISQQEPMQIPEDGKAIIWGIQATDKRSMTFYNSAEETVKQAEWAFVATVTLTD
ncbi:hypothetical protein LOK74_13680 [Brevibacillus humidisoli]|uniref:hypothetical protein n=1 Tax=Brevibacillus humidisoli TaxID=2895522 RepID=UPI001E48B3AE|nr:hypothetical protein [Brevibacillus humidisoli]UFJ39122.1 hypothetical protein LOK74_13680 [Brevibacillus humidisoli]